MGTPRIAADRRARDRKAASRDASAAWRGAHGKVARTALVDRTPRRPVRVARSGTKLISSRAPTATAAPAAASAATAPASGGSTRHDAAPTRASAPDAAEPTATAASSARRRTTASRSATSATSSSLTAVASPTCSVRIDAANNSACASRAAISRARCSAAAARSQGSTLARHPRLAGPPARVRGPAPRVGRCASGSLAHGGANVLERLPCRDARHEPGPEGGDVERRANAVAGAGLDGQGRRPRDRGHEARHP